MTPINKGLHDMTILASCVELYTSLLSMSDVIHITYRQPPKALGALLDFYRETIGTFSIQLNSLAPSVGSQRLKYPGNV